MISFPSGYIVQDNPSSPYSYVSCLRKDDVGYVYRCDSKDKTTFYVEMTISIPQIPQNDTTVYIFGDQCNLQDVCPDLAALADSAKNDTMSLGPFGTWSKVGVVIFICILGFIVLVACFVVVRRNSMANINSRRLDYPDEGDDNLDQFSHNENDDNVLTQMPLKDTLTNVERKISHKDKVMHSPTIKKSSNNDDIKRSKSQRTQDDKKKHTEINVYSEKQPVVLPDLNHNEHSNDNFIQEMDRRSTINRGSLINEKDAYSSNNEIYENSLKTNPRFDASPPAKMQM
ncbi:9203_t:CDS:2 [Cetraspora pellucida]|uniref:9203_t:CDS:1 n=1 Tax=Cetraspora pellucida TaxID=1433469 RepID=A0A9N9NHM4_9GLOM|nr:9203_t:CDS:2 [Cetraspora pellucida]